MTKLSLAAAAVALAAGSTVAAAQSFAYKPGTQRYRLDQTVETTQTVQGMTQNAESRTAQFFSLDLAAQGDGLGVTYVIDSVAVIPPADASPMQAQATAQAEAAAKTLKGRKIVGTVSPLGRVSRLADADSTAAGGEQLAAGFRAFLVAFPTAAVKTGMTWTDTVTNNFRNMGGIDGTTTTVITYTVAGDTTVHGQKAWRVQQEGTLTMSGMGAAQGTDVAMSGTGTIAGVVLVGQSGVLLGADTQQSQNLTVEVPAANMSIPIMNKVTTKIQHVGS
jgi:hypothetical protein